MDRFCAHLGNKIFSVLLGGLVKLFLIEKLAPLKWRLHRINDDVGLKVEDPLDFPKRHVEEQCNS